MGAAPHTLMSFGFLLLSGRGSGSRGAGAGSRRRSLSSRSGAELCGDKGRPRSPRRGPLPRLHGSGGTQTSASPRGANPPGEAAAPETLSQQAGRKGLFRATTDAHGASPRSTRHVHWTNGNEEYQTSSPYVRAFFCKIAHLVQVFLRDAASKKPKLTSPESTWSSLLQSRRSLTKAREASAGTNPGALSCPVRETQQVERATGWRSHPPVSLQCLNVARSVVFKVPLLRRKNNALLCHLC